VIPSSGKTVTVLIASLAVCAVMALAWPRLQATLRFLPVDAAIEAYWKRGELPPEQLQPLLQRSRESIALHPHHRYWDGLSFLYFLEGIDNKNTLSARRLAHEASIEAATESLKRAPAQPRAWLRIARSRSWLFFPPEQVISAFKMAIYTGRVEPTHLLVRLGLGYHYLPLLDEEGRELLRDQTLLAWRLRQREMILILKRGVLDFSLLRTTLSPSHDDVILEMEEALGGAAR
jgi:hypothetical protein